MRPAYYRHLPLAMAYNGKPNTEDYLKNLGKKYPQRPLEEILDASRSLEGSLKSKGVLRGGPARTPLAQLLLVF